jgi:hypothetical protein
MASYFCGSVLGFGHWGDVRDSIGRIRQQTSAYVSSMLTYVTRLASYVSIRQHTSAYVSIRQHTSAYVSIRQLEADVCDSIIADAGEVN